MKKSRKKILSDWRGERGIGLGAFFKSIKYRLKNNFDIELSPLLQGAGGCAGECRNYFLIIAKVPLTRVGNLFFLALLLFSLSGCYEPKEGCLDVRASNFDLDADEACSDCCEFPQLQLDLQHKILVDTVYYNLSLGDSVYYDHFGQPFKIKSIQYYLSKVHLVADDDTEVGVTNEIEIGLTSPAGQMENVEDNFVLVDPATFQTYTLGDFPGEHVFRTLQFSLGLEEPSVFADPATLSEDHPLTVQTNSMYEDGSYIFSKVELFRDTTAADTIPTVLKVLPADGVKKVYLNIPFDYLKVNGFDMKVILRVDYSKWFEGMDVKNGSEAELNAKLAANMPAAFSFVEIE